MTRLLKSIMSMAGGLAVLFVASTIAGIAASSTPVLAAANQPAPVSSSTPPAPPAGTVTSKRITFDKGHRPVRQVCLAPVGSGGTECRQTGSWWYLTHNVGDQVTTADWAATAGQVHADG